MHFFSQVHKEIFPDLQGGHMEANQILQFLQKEQKQWLYQQLTVYAQSSQEFTLEGFLQWISPWVEWHTWLFGLELNGQLDTEVLKEVFQLLTSQQNQLVLAPPPAFVSTPTQQPAQQSAPVMIINNYPPAADAGTDWMNIALVGLVGLALFLGAIGFGILRVPDQIAKKMPGPIATRLALAATPTSEVALDPPTEAPEPTEAPTPTDEPTPTEEAFNPCKFPESNSCFVFNLLLKVGKKWNDAETKLGTGEKLGELYTHSLSKGVSRDQVEEDILCLYGGVCPEPTKEPRRQTATVPAGVVIEVDGTRVAGAEEAPAPKKNSKPNAAPNCDWLCQLGGAIGGLFGGSNNPEATQDEFEQPAEDPTSQNGNNAEGPWEQPTTVKPVRPQPTQVAIENPNAAPADPNAPLFGDCDTGQISGQVTWANGAEAPFLPLFLIETKAQVTTNDHGDFDFFRLELGKRYTIQAGNSQRQVVTLTQCFQWVDIVLSQQQNPPNPTPRPQPTRVVVVPTPRPQPTRVAMQPTKIVVAPTPRPQQPTKQAVPQIVATVTPLWNTPDPKSCLNGVGCMLFGDPNPQPYLGDVEALITQMDNFLRNDPPCRIENMGRDWIRYFLESPGLPKESADQRIANAWASVRSAKAEMCAEIAARQLTPTNTPRPTVDTSGQACIQEINESAGSISVYYGPGEAQDYALDIMDPPSWSSLKKAPEKYFYWDANQEKYFVRPYGIKMCDGSEPYGL